jgi:hypothetical protein
MAYTDIDDPSVHFQTALYTGDGASSKAIVNDGNSDLQPDWLWTKQRNAAQNNLLFDSSRGVTKYLKSGENEAEATNAAFISSFNSDGFTLGNSTVVNDNTDTYVAWQWKANGGTTTSVSASGSGATQIIASTHQANTEAGFSIVTFTAPSIGSGNDYTVSHGLGAIPEVIILKRRDGTGNWHVYHQATGPNGATFLNLTNAFFDAEYFGDTTPTSTVFSQSEGSASDPGHTQIAYCFRSIQGYSKIGSYVGNGSTNGTFAYTGFKPAWVLVKSVDVAQSWQLSDSARNPFNVVNRRLAPNDASAESTAHSWIDFLSNGFKIRINDAAYNNNGQKYIYMAFAENPFCSSKGVPTTAR